VTRSDAPLNLQGISELAIGTVYTSTKIARIVRDIDMQEQLNSTMVLAFQKPSRCT